MIKIKTPEFIRIRLSFRFVDGPPSYDVSATVEGLFDALKAIEEGGAQR